MPTELLSIRPDYEERFSKPLPPNVIVTPVTSTTLPAYRRLISLLLPIRYPDKFYKDSVANTTPSSLALCALWKEKSRNGKRKHAALDNVPISTSDSAESTVVGGIQCRLEPPPAPPTESSPAQSKSALYIQTLAVIAPYRSLGVATALLNSIIGTVITHYSDSTENVTEIYAHVWEANEEALEWYVRRGFVVEKGVLDGYYRKLRPSGARIVRRRLGVGDWLKVKEGAGKRCAVSEGEGLLANDSSKREELGNG